jgi:hypothetical protein
MNQSSAPNPQDSPTPDSALPPKPKPNGIPEINALLQQMEEAPLQPPLEIPLQPPFQPQSSEQEKSSPAVGSSAVTKSRVQQKSWSFSTKMILGAIASTTIPLFLLGIGGYWTGQSLKKDVTEAPAVEAIQTYSTNLLVGTGALVVLSGAIATLVASRATREINTAATTSSALLNRLRREDRSVQSRRWQCTNRPERESNNIRPAASSTALNPRSRSRTAQNSDGDDPTAARSTL